MKRSSRRDFIHWVGLVAVPLLAAYPGGAPRGKGDRAAEITPSRPHVLSCTDESNLTEAQAKTREAVQYVDGSPHAEKRCANCRFFTPPPENAPCGTCEVVPGPIHPEGYCTAWVAPSR